MARLNEIAIRAVVPLALAAMVACGGQLPSSQTGTGGTPGSGGSNDAGGRAAGGNSATGNDAGGRAAGGNSATGGDAGGRAAGGSSATGGAGGACPAPGTDGAIRNCSRSCGALVPVDPVCVGTTWTCTPGSVPYPCPSCPPSWPAGCFCNPGNGVVSCFDAGAPCTEGGQSRLICSSTCSTDVAFPAVCMGGAWACPAGTIDVTTCSGFCTLPPPPGCTCDPTNGALTCKRDGGADAASQRG